MTFIKGHLYGKRFTKGFTPWNKGVNGYHTSKLGYITPEEVKEKQRQAKLKNPTRYWLGKKKSAEYRKKISIGLLGNIPWNKGKPVTEEQRKRLIKMRVDQGLNNPTSIEKTLYEYLLFKGILFEKQRLINGRFVVDAYIPSLNLIIEADGKYWHELDRVVKKDKAENAYLTKCGFNLLRLSEQEIKDGSFKERLVV